MKKLLVLIIFFSSFSGFSQKNNCNESIFPYWYNGIISRIVGESPTLRLAFAKIKQTENAIEPKNGFITLRLNVSKTGDVCSCKTFQIDENYKKTTFNNGKLVNKLEKIALGLTDWFRDKEYLTYNLIRLKIKDGKIEEIF